MELTKKTIAIHQPNYFPWLGFFHKIYSSDEMIFHDNVEHSKKYPTRRTRIRKTPYSGEITWLSVPLKQHSDFSLILDLEIDNSQAWREKHLRKLQNSYFRAPFFLTTFPKVEKWLFDSKRIDKLAELNIYLIKQILNWVSIEKTLYRSSEIPCAGSGSSYNIGLVKHLKGTHYLSGKGAKNYQNKTDFNDEGISLEISEFGSWLSRNPYRQVQGGKPIGGLSVLDSLFNIGPKGIMQLFEQFHLISYGSSSTPR